MGRAAGGEKTVVRYALQDRPTIFTGALKEEGKFIGKGLRGSTRAGQTEKASGTAEKGGTPIRDNSSTNGEVGRVNSDEVRGRRAVNNWDNNSLGST